MSRLLVLVAGADRVISAGIVPSNTTTYPLASIQNAIMSQTGAMPYLGCSGVNHTVLSEVWFYNHLWGSEQARNNLIPSSCIVLTLRFQLGKFKTINATSPVTTCNLTMPIHYYERTPSSEREVRILP
jgi:ribonuclease T2